MDGQVPSFRHFAFLLIGALSTQAAETRAQACPGPGDPDAMCAVEIDPRLLPETKLIGDAWLQGGPEIDEGEGLFGTYIPEVIDWLNDRGIGFFGWYFIALQGNPVGGVNNAFRYSGLFNFGVDLDMEKMAEAKGLKFHISGSSATGEDLTEDVGAFAFVNAVFSGVSFRLFEMYAEQRLARDRFSIRVGRLAVGWEYGLDHDYFTQYWSAAFRLNVFGLDPNTPNFTVIPFANWGARVRWTPNENWRVQASWMNGFPRDFAETKPR